MSGKRFQIVLKARAKRDIYKNWHDISLDNQAAADRFLDRIDTRVLGLSEFPDRGALREDLAKNLRMLIEGNYLIFYKVKSSKVEILRVIHGSRDFTTMFK